MGISGCFCARRSYPIVHRGERIYNPSLYIYSNQLFTYLVPFLGEFQLHDRWLVDLDLLPGVLDILGQPARVVHPECPDALVVEDVVHFLQRSATRLLKEHEHMDQRGHAESSKDEVDLQTTSCGEYEKQRPPQKTEMPCAPSIGYSQIPAE